MEFLKIWEILVRRKWIIIGVFLAFFIAVVIATYTITPTYKGSVKLYVATTDTLSFIMSNLGMKSNTTTTTSQNNSKHETDIALSTTRPLIEETISSLNLKNRKGKKIKYEEIIKLNMVKNIINKFFPQPYIEVDQYEDADMIEIAAYSPSRTEAPLIANKLAELYINKRIILTIEEYRSARIFLEAQIQKVKSEYDKSLSDFKDFKIKAKTVNLDKETENLLSKISTLRTNYEDNEKSIIEAEDKLAKSFERIKRVEKFRKESEEYSKNEQFNTLKSKLNEALISITDKSIDYTKEHPEYKKLEKQVEAIRDIMKIEVEIAFSSERHGIDPVYDQLYKNLTESYIEREVGVSKRKLIQNYLNAYEKELLQIPVKFVDNSKLDLALSVNKNIYQNLLEYLTQIGMAETMTLSNIKIVESAVESDKKYPYFPKKKTNYVIGIILGIFMGFAFGFFVEYIDNTIKSPEDINHIPSLTLIGVIPKSNEIKKQKLVSILDPTAPVVEAYRTIKNSIRYASVDSPVKTLVITSSRESEGKSTIAANTAIMFGMEGKQAIIVDLDLRKPNLHKIFDVNNSNGITNILVEGKQVANAIIHTSVKNVDLLTSGPIPPDPSAMIESERIKDIIQTLKQTYDIVIIDTPPTTVNDAIVIGRFSDRVMLVIEYGKATFSNVNHVKELFDKAGINIIGVILNKFKVHRTSYYSYNYYNSYSKK